MFKIKDFIKRLFGIDSKTYMEREIYEQPDVVKSILNRYLKRDDFIDIELPQGVKKIALTASGSSYHSAAAAANFIRANTNLYAQAYYASESALLHDITVDDETLYIFISQSGETYDTNEALKKIAPKTDKTLALTNTKDSTLYNNAKIKILTLAGTEKAIASTKAMCAQTFCLFLISAKLMQMNNIPPKPVLEELKAVPAVINKVFEKTDIILKYSKILSNYNNATVLATGMFYPLAKEAALKIKETSYINTTAYPTGEFLHGHVAILNKKCAVISFVNDGNIEFMMNVIKRIDEDYETDSLIVTASAMTDLYDKTVIHIPCEGDIVFWFGSLILLQLLALKTAELLERDVDKPNGLSKILKQ